MTTSPRRASSTPSPCRRRSGTRWGRSCRRTCVFSPAYDLHLQLPRSLFSAVRMPTTCACTHWGSPEQVAPAAADPLPERDEIDALFLLDRTRPDGTTREERNRTTAAQRRLSEAPITVGRMPKYVDENGGIRWTRIVYVIVLKRKRARTGARRAKGPRCRPHSGLRRAKRAIQPRIDSRSIEQVSARLLGSSEVLYEASECARGLQAGSMRWPRAASRRQPKRELARRPAQAVAAGNRYCDDGGHGEWLPEGSDVKTL